VKTNGISPIVLVNKIKKKIPENINCLPINLPGPNTALNSLSRPDIILSNNFVSWEPTIQYAWGIKNLTLNTITQLYLDPNIKILVFGSKEEKRFVTLNFYCGTNDYSFTDTIYTYTNFTQIMKLN